MDLFKPIRHGVKEDPQSYEYTYTGFHLIPKKYAEMASLKIIAGR